MVDYHVTKAAAYVIILHVICVHQYKCQTGRAKERRRDAQHTLTCAFLPPVRIFIPDRRTRDIDIDYITIPSVCAVNDD